MAGTSPAMTTSNVDASLNKSDTDIDRLRDALTREARAIGFDCIGIAEPGAIADAGQHFREFIATGAHGDMDWLAAQPERRVDPRGLWQDVRSVIMLGVNYGPDHDPLAILEQRTRAAISVYAQGDDYHDLIKKRLKALARWLVATAPCEVKVFVDTAAVMEKPLVRGAAVCALSQLLPREAFAAVRASAISAEHDESVREEGQAAS